MTQLLVLALLNIKPMSGYDIKQMLELTQIERWSGVLVGSIYHALKTLENDEYIQIANIEQTGHRQRAVYKITSKGQAYLNELIIDAIQVPSVSYPSALYTGLSFFQNLPKDMVQKALLEQIENLDREYRELQIGFNKKSEASKGNIPPMVQLIFENMFANIELQRSFVVKTLEFLESQ